MNVIPLQSWIPRNIRATVKGMLLESYDEQSLASLDQDVLEICVDNEIRIDVGWFPEGDPNGRFVIRVYRKDGARQIRSPIETKLPLVVAKTVGDLIREYGSPDDEILASAQGVSSKPLVKH